MKAKSHHVPLNLLDFNLLLDFDTLLREGSVVGAARQLHLSPPAMSRRLTRLREAIGDPLFVPAGRGLVPTKRALALQERVRMAIETVRGVFTPEAVDFKKMERTFTLRANDGFAGSFATQLTAAMKSEAPGACIKLLPRMEKSIDMLRNGTVDLDLGIAESFETEVQSEVLLDSQFVGVVRRDHPLFRKNPRKGVTIHDLVAWEHVSTSPHGQGGGRLDAALKKHGMQRRLAIVAPGFQAALVMVASSDFIGVLPEPFARWALQHLRLQIFNLPVATSMVEISHSWHIRHSLDPAHQWLRNHVKEICRRNVKQV